MASIYKQGRIYWLQYYRNGKRFQESLKTASRDEAKYLKAKKEAELIERPNHLQTGTLDARRALEAYHQDTAHLKTKHTRINAYLHIKHYFDSFSPSTLQDITAHTLRAYLLKRLEEKSIGIVTANNIIRSVKTFLEWHVANHGLSSNPLKGFKQYKEPKTPKPFLTHEQVNQVLEKAKLEPTLYPAIATAIYAGLRKGELRRIRWEDIDMDKDIILVRYAKSGRFRTVPLNSKLKRIFLDYRQKHTTGLCFNLVNEQRQLARLSTDDLPLKWHLFRHTFASLLAQDGVSIYKIAKWLGHSTARVTEIYAHLAPNMDEDINRI